jgi:hypothetical protein
MGPVRFQTSSRDGHDTGGKPSAGAEQFWPRVIGGVSVEPLFQRSGGQTQSLPPRRYLHSFEIQIPDGLAA